MQYLIIDLEMSGTESGFHEIIEIGAVLANSNWKKISEFQSLVYPENLENWSEKAEKIHGISVEELEDAPMMNEVLDDFEKWLRKAAHKLPGESLTDIIIGGQSILNDINFLQIAYEYLDIDWPFSKRLIDLLSISVLFYEILKNNKIQPPKSYSLATVAAFFKLEREEDTHSALEDAELTYKCFREYFALAQKLVFKS